MAEIKFECPHCGQHIVADEEYAGINCECPICSQALTVPSEETINTEACQQRCTEDVCQSMDTARYRIINRKVYRSQKEFDTAIQKLSSGLCKKIRIEDDKRNHLLFVLQPSKKYEISYFVNKKRNTLRQHIPSKYIPLIFKNCFENDDFSTVLCISSEFQRRQREWNKTKGIFQGCLLGCGAIVGIIILILVFGSIMMQLESGFSSTSSSSSNAGGYQCKGCTAWSPSPFGSGGYCSRCAEKRAKTYMERFAERAIKEETGLDSRVRLEENNGKYEFKVSY